MVLRTFLFSNISPRSKQNKTKHNNKKKINFPLKTKRKWTILFSHFHSVNSFIGENTGSPSYWFVLCFFFFYFRTSACLLLGGFHTSRDECLVTSAFCVVDLLGSSPRDGSQMEKNTKFPAASTFTGCVIFFVLFCIPVNVLQVETDLNYLLREEKKTSPGVCFARRLIHTLQQINGLAFGSCT